MSIFPATSCTTNSLAPCTLTPMPSVVPWELPEISMRLAASNTPPTTIGSPVSLTELPPMKACPLVALIIILPGGLLPQLTISSSSTRSSVPPLTKRPMIWVSVPAVRLTNPSELIPAAVMPPRVVTTMLSRLSSAPAALAFKVTLLAAMMALATCICSPAVMLTVESLEPGPAQVTPVSPISPPDTIGPKISTSAEPSIRMALST